MNNWKERIKTHAQNNSQYSLRDLQQHLQSKTDVEEFATMVRQNKHKPLREFFSTSNDWQAFVPPALLSTVSRFGLVEELPSGLITPVSESRESVTKRFIWKSEPIEDYSEGEAFKETYIEGATSTIKWRKPGAKISETRERAMDLPLSVLQLNAELTTNEFKAREWKHFMHEMHNGTSNAFDIRATLKNGVKLLMFAGMNFSIMLIPQQIPPFMPIGQTLKTPVVKCFAGNEMLSDLQYAC